MFVSYDLKESSKIRRVIYQVLRAFALIMLLLFELGMGLFISANDIPCEAWAIVFCFGAAYVISVYVIESIQEIKKTRGDVYDPLKSEGL